MKSEATWVAVAGAVVALLSALGLITASEGTALTTNAASAISGVVGLVGTIIAIVKRRKSEKPDAEG